MIVTLTLNPCIDLNIEVEEFRFDAPLRALRERERAGGKGVNAAVVLGLLGLEATAITPLGGAAGREYLRLARQTMTVPAAPGAEEESGASSPARPPASSPARPPALPPAPLPVSSLAPSPAPPPAPSPAPPPARQNEMRARLLPIPVQGATRTNTVITARRDGRNLKVNRKGAALSSAELEWVCAALRRELEPGDRLVLAGSLPPQTAPDIYAVLIAEFKEKGCFAALDCDGEAFRLGVRAGPDFVKPNRDELARFAGEALDSEKAILEAAQEILEAGVAACLITDGPRPAFLVASEGAWKGTPPPANGSPTGSGDAALAGFLAGLVGGTARKKRRDPSVLQRAFHLALACGSAAASMPDTEYFTPEVLERCRKQTRIERIR